MNGNSALQTDCEEGFFELNQDKCARLYPGFALEPGVWRESTL